MCEKILLLLLLTMTTAACVSRYNVRPGVLNAADSAAYGTLLAAETAIDQARNDNQSRPLPADVKLAMNTLVKSYNVARGSWLTYRGAIATKSPADRYLAELNNNVSDLANAIRTLKEVKP